MHHISLGRPLKGTPVILIIDDLNTALSTNKQASQSGTSPSTPTSATNHASKREEPPNRGFGGSDVLTHHNGARGGT